MLREWFCHGSCRRRAWAWFGLLIFLGHNIFRAYIKVRLAEWYKLFYDSLQDTEWPSGETEDDHMAAKREEVSDHLFNFALIVLPAVFVHPVARWISSQWLLGWRLTLIESYLSAYQTTRPAIEGAAQRIHEDTQRFTNGMYACFNVLLDSVFTLVIFLPVLINLGRDAQLPSWEFDGWLAIVAFSCAFGGLLVSMVVGYQLVRLEVSNQMVEAALRKKLVILESDPCAVVGVEAADNNAIDSLHFEEFRSHRRPCAVSPLQHFQGILVDLRTNYSSLYKAFAAFNFWISTYDQTLIVLPYWLIAPLLFADEQHRISLGTLTKTTSVFANVFGALAVLGERWADVNEFRSTLVRLRQFEATIYPPPLRRQRHVAVSQFAEVASSVELSEDMRVERL